MESKLMNIRCDNCGAEYRVSSRGELVCRFCGSKIYMTDRDFEDYQHTRDEMLESDRFTNDMAENDGDVLGLWQSASLMDIATESGTHIKFESYYSVALQGKEIYIGKTKIAIIFDNRGDAQGYEDIIKEIVYPSADIKGLGRYLPNITFSSRTADGGYVLILSKEENIYPLFLFSDLKPTTVAWMISRLENLGCLLEFNDMDFRKLALEDLYINPKTHELFIFGGWENVSHSKRRNYLEDLREIAKGLTDINAAPELCRKFLNGRPKSNAYDDFKAWDDVIMNGFGGHNFHQFSENDQK